MSGFEPARARRIIDGCLADLDLDLTGLTVFTEAATGAYLYAPLLAALAGAEKVHAVTATSRFGRAQDVRQETLALARLWGVAERLDVHFQKREEDVVASDIITNSGFVRPIDRRMIGWMKPTAVVPLMWETWEFRPSDLDLNACKQRGILVLGTKEQEPPCDIGSFAGYMGLKLIFDLGFDGGKILVLGNADLPGGNIVEQMRANGIDVTWASAEPEGDLLYDDLSTHFRARGNEYDIMVVAEHKHRFPLLGSSGLIGFDKILAVNPTLRIGVISGNVDAAELKASGLHHLPEHIAPVGTMSYQLYMMGPRPVLMLYAAGLKVGGAMSRARRKGYSLEDAATEAIATSPAMDFTGEWAWLQ